jgi:hypothetical protein
MTQISEQKVRSRTAAAGRDHDKNDLIVGEVFPNGHSVDFNVFWKSQLDASQRPQIGLQGEITRSLSTNWHQIAIPRFFADYVSRSDVLGSGSLRFLRDIYSQRICRVNFDEALRAVAFMSLANQLSKAELSVEARKLYGSAIIRVATKLQNVEEAADDTILASSFLFSMFQVVFCLLPLSRSITDLQNSL